MNKRLLTIGLVLTAVLAVGVGLAFRSVVSAVAGAQTGRSALAQLERALNAGEVDAQPSTGAAPADPNADPNAVTDVVSNVVVASGVAAARIDEGPGVLVTGLVKDGAAAKAGIARGDIVLGIDGKDIQRFADLTKALKGKAEGDAVRLKVQHGDEVRDRDVTLQSGGGAAQLGIASCGGGMAPRIAIRHAIGGGPAVVDTVTADSPAAKAGLKEGDRITAVDGEKLTGHTIAFAHGAMHNGPSNGMGFFRRLFGHDEAQADPSTAPSAVDPTTADGAEGGPDNVPGVAALPVEPSAETLPLGEAKPGLTLADAIARHKPGDTVKLTVEHDGEAAREVSVVLGAHPDDAGFPDALATLANIQLRHGEWPAAQATITEALAVARARRLSNNEDTCCFSSTQHRTRAVRQMLLARAAVAHGCEHRFESRKFGGSLRLLGFDHCGSPMIHGI